MTITILNNIMFILTFVIFIFFISLIIYGYVYSLILNYFFWCFLIFFIIIFGWFIYRHFPFILSRSLVHYNKKLYFIFKDFKNFIRKNNKNYGDHFFYNTYFFKIYEFYKVYGNFDWSFFHLVSVSFRSFYKIIYIKYNNFIDFKNMKFFFYPNFKSWHFYDFFLNRYNFKFTYFGKIIVSRGGYGLLSKINKTSFFWNSILGLYQYNFEDEFDSYGNNLEKVPFYRNNGFKGNPWHLVTPSPLPFMLGLILLNFILAMYFFKLNIYSSFLILPISFIDWFINLFGQTFFLGDTFINDVDVYVYTYYGNRVDPYLSYLCEDMLTFYDFFIIYSRYFCGLFYFLINVIPFFFVFWEWNYEVYMESFMERLHNWQINRGFIFGWILFISSEAILFLSLFGCFFYQVFLSDIFLGEVYYIFEDCIYYSYWDFLEAASVIEDLYFEKSGEFVSIVKQVPVTEVNPEGSYSPSKASIKNEESLGTRLSFQFNTYLLGNEVDFNLIEFDEDYGSLNTEIIDIKDRFGIENKCVSGECGNIVDDKKEKGDCVSGECGNIVDDKKEKGDCVSGECGNIVDDKKEKGDCVSGECGGYIKIDSDSSLVKTNLNFTQNENSNKYKLVGIFSYEPIDGEYRLSTDLTLLFGNIRFFNTKNFFINTNSSNYFSFFEFSFNSYYDEFSSFVVPYVFTESTVSFDFSSFYYSLECISYPLTIDIPAKSDYILPLKNFNFFEHGLLFFDRLNSGISGISDIYPFGFPLINTLILLISGMSITGMVSLVEILYPVYGNFYFSFGFINGTFISVIWLGFLFLIFQFLEYKFGVNFFIGDGIYSSYFFLITGLHGFHVFMGMIFLSLACQGFSLKNLTVGFFSSTNNISFDSVYMASWYWHFVDYIWIFVWGFLYQTPLVFFDHFFTYLFNLFFCNYTFFDWSFLSNIFFNNYYLVYFLTEVLMLDCYQENFYFELPFYSLSGVLFGADFLFINDLDINYFINIYLTKKDFFLFRN